MKIEPRPIPILSVKIDPRPIEVNPTPENASAGLQIAAKGIVESDVAVRGDVQLAAIVTVARRPVNFENKKLLRALIMRYRQENAFDL